MGADVIIYGLLSFVLGGILGVGVMCCFVISDSDDERKIK